MVVALSIVTPAVQRIIRGAKRTEIRSWRPISVPLRNLALMENENYLRIEGAEEEGLLRAVADVVGVHAWTQEEALADRKTWEPGYFAWELANVRELPVPIACIAKRRLYELVEVRNLPPDLVSRW